MFDPWQCQHVLQRSVTDKTFTVKPLLLKSNVKPEQSKFFITVLRRLLLLLLVDVDNILYTLAKQAFFHLHLRLCYLYIDHLWLTVWWLDMLSDVVYLLVSYHLSIHTFSQSFYSCVIQCA